MPRRHDVLESWLSHRQISPRQAEAGRRFRDLFDVAGVEGHATLQAGAPRVSLQERCRGTASARVMAQSELEALRGVLGVFDFALVSRVVGAGQDISGATVNGSASTSDPHAGTDAERRYLAHRIRDALGMLASRFLLEAA